MDKTNGSVEAATSSFVNIATQYMAWPCMSKDKFEKLDARMMLGKNRERECVVDVFPVGAPENERLAVLPHEFVHGLPFPAHLRRPGLRFELPRTMWTCSSE